MDSPKRQRFDSSLNPPTSSTSSYNNPPPVASSSSSHQPYFNMSAWQEYQMLCCIEDNQINKLLENVRALHNDTNLIDAQENGHLENQAVLFAINMHGLQNNCRLEDQPVVAFDELSPSRIPLSSPSSSSSGSDCHEESKVLSSDIVHHQEGQDAIRNTEEPTIFDFGSTLEHDMEQRGILCAINFHGLYTANNHSS